MAVVALVDVAALDRTAGEFLGVLDDGLEGVPVVGVAGKRLGVQHELTAGGAAVGGDDGDLDADLWTTPALQVGFEKMLNRSAPIYPASKWSCCSEPTWISARFCPQ